MANTILRYERTETQDAEFSAKFPAMIQEIVIFGDQVSRKECERMYSEIVNFLRENTRATETTRSTTEGVNGFISISGNVAWYITTKGSLVTLGNATKCWYKLCKTNGLLYREGYLCKADINRIKALEGRE